LSSGLRGTVVFVNDDDWPSLPYEEWRDTRDTLHMYTQVIGKLRLALSPFEPQWANVPLYLTARGLTTTPIPFGSRTLDAEFDLIDHTLVLRTGDGGIERRPLGGAVADFYQDVMGALSRLHVDVAISVLPSEVSHPIPFPDDRTHSTYEPAHAARFFRVLSLVDVLTKAHRAGFRGRTSPVQFFWGTFDLALIRSGPSMAPPPPESGVIRRYGLDAEVICTGWWPGDERVPYPAFYAYGFPKPEGIETATIQPTAAKWMDQFGEFILPYEAARTLRDPGLAVLEFFRTTYDNAATRLGWDPGLTQVSAPPSSATVP
jgi:Family of unknown function (DUF5996)